MLLNNHPGFFNTEHGHLAGGWRKGANQLLQKTKCERVPKKNCQSNNAILRQSNARHSRLKTEFFFQG